jgi:lactam utilization protein B
MSALQLLEKSAKLDQHLASHVFAERIYEHVQELIAEGHDLASIHDAVRELHRRAREANQAVQRDAFVEVLDELEAEYPSGSADASSDGMPAA